MTRDCRIPGRFFGIILLYESCCFNYGPYSLIRKSMPRAHMEAHLQGLNMHEKWSNRHFKTIIYDS